MLQSKGRIIKNGVIYTDGSWKDQREMKDILFRKSYNLSDASSAVVIIDKEDDWKQKEAITIRITANTPNVKEQLTKAFTMEAIAILAATQILKWYNHEAEITTDCRGVLDMGKSWTGTNTTSYTYELQEKIKLDKIAPGKKEESRAIYKR